MDASASQHHFSFATLWEHLRQDRRYLAGVGLGFASGVPFQLVYYTQSAWWSDAGIPLHTIGVLVELTIAYKFKFLWAPFLDRYDPPIFGALLGRRRGWIVVSQILCMATLAGVAFGDPAHFLGWTVAFSLALGVAGATQDITIDGWRINVAPEGKQALMTAFTEIGYRFGTLASGAGALMLGQHFGWRVSYLVMAALLLVGAASAWLSPEPDLDKAPHGRHPGFIETIWTPIKDLWTRLGGFAAPVLILVAGFRMPGYLTSAMAMPLFKNLKLTEDEIALVTKSFGFPIALAATVLSAYVVRKLGILRALFVGTAAGSASHLALAWLAGHGNEFWAFCLAVSIEGFAYAFAQMVLIVFMSLIVSKENAASQFALLTSLCALPGSLLAATSGFIVEKVGFVHFFIATSLIGVPVALLAWWLARRGLPALEQEGGGAAT